MQKKIIAFLLALLSLGQVQATVGGHPTAVTLPKNTAYDSRGFPAFFKVAFPTTLNFNAGDNCSIQLNTYAAVGDKDVVDSPVWGSISPTITKLGTLPTGMTLDTANLDNAFLSCQNLTAGTNSFTLNFDNSVGTAISVTTVWTVSADAVPDPFNFIDQSNVATTATITSAAVTITGLGNAVTTAAVTVSNGTWSKNGGAFGAGAGTVVNGDTVQVQHTSSSSDATAVSTVLTIGGVTDTFTSITGTPADTQPTAFSFTPQSGVALATAITSNTVTITGITAASTTTVSGGLWSKNGGAFGAGAGSVVLNDTVAVRVTSSSSANTPTSVTLTIGGITGTFTVTTAAAGGQTLVQGTGSQNYFVKSGGNDTADGRTDATAWGTLGRVNSAFNAATVGAPKVWLKSGSTFSNQTITIDWPGNSVTDQVIVGTYVMNGGTAQRLLPSNLSADRIVTDYTWAAPRAILQGSYRPACRVWPSKCTVGPGSTPASAYDFMVTNIGMPFVTVESLDVRDSAGGGIQIQGYLTSGIYPSHGEITTQDYYTIQYNRVDHVNYQGLLWSTSTYGTIRGNDVGYTGIGNIDGHSRTCPTSTDCGPDGGGIYIVHCDPCHVVLENNFFHDVWAETVGLGDGSFMLIKGNIFASNRRTGIYLDGVADIIVEQNMGLGGTYTWEPGLGNPAQQVNAVAAFYHYTALKESSLQSGGNIGVADAASERNMFRNNLGATFNTCLVGGMINDASGDNFRLSGGYWNNTCIGVSGKTLVALDGSGPQTLGAGGFPLQNNLLATTTGAPVCNNTIQAMLFDHNTWTGTPADTDCRTPGTGDVYTTFAALALPSFPSWASTSKTVIPLWTDFRPAAATTAVGAPALSSAYLTIANWQWEYDNMVWVPPNCGVKPSATEWAKKRNVDYCGLPADGTTSGAINHAP